MKLIAALASATALIGFAHAGTITSSSMPGDDMPDLVVGEASLAISGEDFVQGEEVFYSETFLAGPIAAGATAVASVIFPFPEGPAGFDNLILSITSSAGTFDFQITEDVEDGGTTPGAQLTNTFAFNVAPGENFTVDIVGSAVSTGEANASFEFAFSASEVPPAGEVPVPAAALLMLGGLAAMRTVRGRKA
ncbi:VPLPA-CTERM sorting domain-containing protein [Parvularcula maris]|uniref:VPLPA-CTERM sorting domain-containing protein n=1 Tax=Parvularcula maris TaxID=2965077 RepID=A0A9X2LA79_9PROT|nr:VPLPA-CTERM sorting domain-containing protein [Parvularcula maris]MCQ8185929.1 VPLPA-CTERM sorting domain-containing protein [Parvularcula maris]